MQLIKSHISLILALFSILFSLQLQTTIDRTVKEHEKILTQEYSMVMIASSQPDIKNLKIRYSIIENIESISTDKVIERFRKDLTKQNLGLLKTMLPKFYRVSLNEYPTPKKVRELSSSLSGEKSIIKIESFAKSHDQIYTFLKLLNIMSSIFLFSIAIVSILLIVKQMRIWQFEHYERMNIMALFGAPVFLRSAVLFKTAMVDATIASFLVIGTLLFVENHPMLNHMIDTLNIKMAPFELTNDSLKLIGTSFLISATLALVVIFQQEEEL